jgi:hypothetical protein
LVRMLFKPRKVVLSVEEHRQAARDLQTINDLSIKLSEQFSRYGKCGNGTYIGLRTIIVQSKQARMRAYHLFRREHPEMKRQDIYGLYS